MAGPRHWKIRKSQDNFWGIKQATALSITDVSRFWRRHWVYIPNHPTHLLADYFGRVNPRLRIALWHASNRGDPS